MEFIQQFLFLILGAVAIWLFSKKIGELRSNINLGRAEDVSGHQQERWKNVLLLAFGQKKMFKKPLVALFHFVIYAGFIIINIEVLEIVIDGLFGSHRILAPVLDIAYPWLINSFEFLAVAVILVCIIFLARRNILRLKRFNQPE